MWIQILRDGLQEETFCPNATLSPPGIISAIDESLFNVS